MFQTSSSSVVVASRHNNKDDFGLSCWRQDMGDLSGVVWFSASDGIFLPRPAWQARRHVTLRYVHEPRWQKKRYIRGGGTLDDGVLI